MNEWHVGLNREGGANPSFASHYDQGTQWSMWMQDEYEVYMDSYMASDGPCFMIIWIIFIDQRYT